MLGPNCTCVAVNVAVKDPHENPDPSFPGKVPELASFSFQSSGPSSLLVCSSFFPFPSQYMISSELGGERLMLLLVEASQPVLWPLC